MAEGGDSLLIITALLAGIALLSFALLAGLGGLAAAAPARARPGAACPPPPGSGWN